MRGFAGSGVDNRTSQSARRWDVWARAWRPFRGFDHRGDRSVFAARAWTPSHYHRGYPWFRRLSARSWPRRRGGGYAPGRGSAPAPSPGPRGGRRRARAAGPCGSAPSAGARTARRRSRRGGRGGAARSAGCR